MLTCEQVRAWLPGYAVGAGSRRWRARLGGHLHACPTCQSEFRALERTGQLLSTLAAESAPAASWPAISSRLVAREAAPARPHGLDHLWRPRWRLALVSLLLLVVGVGLSGLAPRRHAPPVVVPVASYDRDVRESLESHLASARFAPLADRAALGLGLEAAGTDS